jgi:hypothetical protein
MVASQFVGALPSLSALRLVGFHRWRRIRNSTGQAPAPGVEIDGEELEPRLRLWEGATRFIRREAWIRSEECLRSFLRISRWSLGYSSATCLA